MVGRNICGLLPTTLLFQCHPSGALNFEMDPRFWKNCTFSGNQLCGEKHSGALCNKIVLRFPLCCPHLHTGLTECPVRKKRVCLYVALASTDKFDSHGARPQVLMGH
jgi:hypothetical protein